MHMLHPGGEQTTVPPNLGFTKFLLLSYQKLWQGTQPAGEERQQSVHMDD